MEPAASSPNATVENAPASPAWFPSFTDGLPLTRRALAFATQRHAGQQREADHAPFILHPLEVAQLLSGRDYPDAVVAAGVLHELIEDERADPAEIEALFGPEVHGLVCGVTEPLHEGPWPERKRLLRAAIAGAPDDAAIVYAADKVAKVRELRLRIAAGHLPDGSSPTRAERLAHYHGSLELLELKLGTHPFVKQLRFEIEALERLPPSR